MRNECLEEVKTCPWLHIHHMVKQGSNPEALTPEHSYIPGHLGDGAGKFLEPLVVLGAELVLQDLLLCQSFPPGLGFSGEELGNIFFLSFLFSAPLRLLVQADVLSLCREIDRPWRDWVDFCEFLLSLPMRMSLLLFLFLPMLLGC